MPSEFERQRDVLDRALHIYNQRTEKYGDAWRGSGARGQASRARDKAQRFMNNINRVTRADHVDVEDALDAINHLVFAVRCAEEGNLTGTLKFDAVFCGDVAHNIGAPPGLSCILNVGHDDRHIGREGGSIWTWQ